MPGAIPSQVSTPVAQNRQSLSSVIDYRLLTWTKFHWIWEKLLLVRSSQIISSLLPARRLHSARPFRTLKRLIHYHLALVRAFANRAQLKIHLQLHF